MKRSTSPTFWMAALAVTLALMLPFTLSPTEGIEGKNACADGSSTCCTDYFSACSGVGVGWYDTGMCGPCDSLYSCGPTKPTG